MTIEDYLKRLDKTMNAINIAYRNTSDWDKRDEIKGDLDILQIAHRNLIDEIASFKKDLDHIEKHYPIENSLS